MQGKIALEEHFAIEPTLDRFPSICGHVWEDLGDRLLDIHGRLVLEKWTNTGSS